MDNQGDDSPEERGMHVNTSEWDNTAPNCPAWAMPRQRENWKARGLILWDERLQRIIKLSAQQALEVLTYLRAETAWKQGGLVIGEPAITLMLKPEPQECESVLTDQMTLSNADAKQLFQLLQDTERALQEMAKAEDQDRRQALGRVYGLLLDLARQRKAGTWDDIES